MWAALSFLNRSSGDRTFDVKSLNAIEKASNGYQRNPNPLKWMVESNTKDNYEERMQILGNITVPQSVD